MPNWGWNSHWQKTSWLACFSRHAEERERQHVAAVYWNYLARIADPSELAFWVQTFNDGDANEKIIANFAATDECFSKHT